MKFRINEIKIILILIITEITSCQFDFFNSIIQNKKKRKEKKINVKLKRKIRHCFFLFTICNTNLLLTMIKFIIIFI